MTTSPESLGEGADAGLTLLAPTPGWGRLARNPKFWLLVGLMTAITLSHYGPNIEQLTAFDRLLTEVGLSRFDVQRILYLVPIIWSGFLFGRRAVLITAALSLAFMAPRAVAISPHPGESLLETFAVFLVGGWAGFSSALLMEERDRHLQLEALYRVSSVASTSLDLHQILDSSIERVMDVLRVDAVLVFLVDDESGALMLTAYDGISDVAAEEFARLSLAGSLNGRVARNGEPLYVEDSLTSPQVTYAAVRREGIRSQLIVPLRSKGNVLGTLCAATRRHRRFLKGEVELLIAVGNHIGVAVEKARLYAQKDHMEEDLRFYVQQITRAQEEERKRIARELHDDTIQALVIHSRRLDELASDEQATANAIRDRLEKLREETNDIIHGVRRLSRDLRPATIDRLGLLPALERLAADVAERARIEVVVSARGAERRLPDEVTITLFRIAQEALTNVWRHAQASRADLVVEFTENRVRLIVGDDGRGFTPRTPLAMLPRDGKLGLAGMEERSRLLGGTVRIDSTPGEGTTVTVEAPV
ncbi:MAG: GAF domain-containing sensor histidine kinase [Chloroflexota bacterium]